MGARLTLKDMERLAVLKEMPLGTHEAVFERADYKVSIDEEGDEGIDGVFLHFQEFKPLYLAFFNNEINYQFDYLLEQLGIEDCHTLDAINEKKGAIIKVSRYLKDVEQNMTPEDFNDWVKENPNIPIEAVENEDGTYTMTRTFTNTNFNIRTIKEEA